eukprot:10286672-Alexandrium_andersonii.AAC.1
MPICLLLPAVKVALPAGAALSSSSEPALAAATDGPPSPNRTHTSSAGGARGTPALGRPPPAQ